MSEEKREALIMEVELPENGRLLFFVNKPIYTHQDLTENGSKAEFYYYNSGTCPINWIRDVQQIAYVNGDGIIEMDPHGLIRLGMTEQDVSISSDCMKRDEDYQVIAFRYLEKEKEVLKFLSSVENNEEESVILELWNKIIFDRQSLMVLSKVCFEKEEILLVEITEGGYSIYHACNTISVNTEDKNVLDRIKFLLEFNILSACIF